MNIEQFKIGTGTKVFVKFIEERTTGKGNLYYTGQASLTQRIDEQKDWDKDNRRYVNFSLKSFDEQELKDGDMIQLDSFYIEQKQYYSKKYKEERIALNLIISKFTKIVNGEPAKAEKVEVDDDSLPF